MKKLLIILLILGIHGPAYASAERNFYCTREGNISIIHYFKFDKDYFYWIYGEKSYSDGKKYWNNRTKASITSHNLIANGDDMEVLEWFEFIDFGNIVWKKPKGKYYSGWKFYFDYKSMRFLIEDWTEPQNVVQYKHDCVEIKKRDLPK